MCQPTLHRAQSPIMRSWLVATLVMTGRRRRSISARSSRVARCWFALSAVATSANAQSEIEQNAHPPRGAIASRWRRLSTHPLARDRVRQQLAQGRPMKSSDESSCFGCASRREFIDRLSGTLLVETLSNGATVTSDSSARSTSPSTRPTVCSPTAARRETWIDWRFAGRA